MSIYSKKDLNILIKYNITNNPNLLNLLSNVAKEYLISEAKKLNNPQSSLILNHFDYSQKNFNNFQYIFGPVSLSLAYNSKFDKVIYLFGDIHEKIEESKDQKIIKIDDFIAFYVKHTDQIIDIFLEIYPRDKFEWPDSYIGDVVYKFKDCFMFRKNYTECQYKLGRFHYIDIRQLAYKNKTSFLYLLNDVLNIKLRLDKYKVDKQKLFTFYKEMTILTTKYKKYFETFDALLENLFKEYKQSKLEKQLENIEDKSIKTKLLKWFDNKVHYYDNEKNISELINIPSYYEKNIKHLLFHEIELEDFEEDNKYMEVDNIEVLYEISKFTTIFLMKFVYLNSLFMDLFAIARIFRSFRKNKGIWSKQARNIFLYTGSVHTGHYLDLLKNYLNFNILYNISADDNRLINIKNFPLTFNRDLIMK
jgi:hypothetical protein